MPTNTSNKISVLMLVQALPPMPIGGAEVQAMRLAKRLALQNIEVVFICPGLKGSKSYDVIEGLKIYRLRSILNALLDLSFFLQKKAPRTKTTIEFDDAKGANNKISKKIGVGAWLRYRIFMINAKRFLRKHRSEFNLIHVHTIEWPAYIGALLSREFQLPLLAKDSTMNGLDNIERYPDGVSKRRTIVETAYFVAMTKCIYNSFISHSVDAKKIFQIPNGIEIDSIFKVSNGSTNKVLFIGNLYQQPAKGVDILLKAWKAVILDIPDAELIIVGDGDIDAYKSYVSDQAIANTTFVGKDPNVKRRLIDAEIFVLPSRREGMSNALMEAMLAGLPCIATDISGCQDLIAHGENGLLVPPGNVFALSEAIVSLLRNRALREKFGVAARETIISKCDIDHVAREYKRVYNVIINDMKPSGSVI